MEFTIEILGVLGSVASIVGLMTSYDKENKKSSIRNLILYLLLFIISIIAGACFYSYKKITNEKLRMKERKEEIVKEAKLIIESSPYYISKYQPGENEGIILSTLVLLEKNKDLFPETYEIFKRDVIQKIQSSNKSTGWFKESEDLENAAKASLQILKTFDN